MLTLERLQLAPLPEELVEQSLVSISMMLAFRGQHQLRGRRSDR